ncbi:L,D-transpeptidase family protein [Sphingomonas sp. S-NIH.Pt15_0812]|jgi:lipoprotein-anchoring transpeptidase ErfK/SrfK|uniref:L,D-transpeptidase family protein n=1 Tax=Sphingomonas sp. S-NIH.Pt15_0812 TaxID=1920129 RepID=UPI000F7E9E78|nr:L,D-transpeptidase family protein [Sphingomonas sp. S-NIH.Pt15_0812]RSU48070.1 murein L,D-transpeptidase [Sphingomonas sp. S-NIH.Pt15_0812]
MGRITLSLVAALAAPAAIAQTPPAAAPVPIDPGLMKMQVVLDRLGFSPGVIDGRPGMSLTAAIKGFQESRGLKTSGEPDAATMAALRPYWGTEATKVLTLDARVLAGPYIDPIPHGEDQQAKLPGLYYRSPLEKLAEMFHTTPQVLVALNSPQTWLRPGSRVTFPNVLPSSRAYDAKLRPDWIATLNGLNVDAVQPQAAKLVVDKSDKVLRVYDKADKLVAQFQVTTGSTHDPLPIGKWTVKGADYNPKFHFNPALFWDADKDDKKAMLPPGPNGPVGVVWLDLSKPHYGIHGTPEPQLIGRTESHGCVRLANWNVARLALMVKPGTPAIFQE